MLESRVEAILGEAAKLEKQYMWLEASGLFKQALESVEEEDYFGRGQIQEKIGYAHRRAAFQAENREEFRKKMREAIQAYEDASRFYERLADEKKIGWLLRSRAISRDLNYWLTSEPSQKRKLLDECLELEEKALKAF